MINSYFRELVSNTNSPIGLLKKLLYSKHQADLVFKVGRTGELIHAHKLILTIASEAFFALYNDGLAVSDNPVVIERIKPATFKQVLRYIYCGEAVLTIDNAIGIYYASENYMLTDLSEICQRFINRSVNGNNVLTIFNNNRQYEIDFVNKICLKIIQENPLKYFRSNYFLTLSQPALQLIVNDQKDQLCKAIKEWRKANNSTAIILPTFE